MGGLSEEIAVHQLDVRAVQLQGSNNSALRRPFGCREDEGDGLVTAGCDSSCWNRSPPQRAARQRTSARLPLAVDSTVTRGRTRLCFDSRLNIARTAPRGRCCVSSSAPMPAPQGSQSRNHLLDLEMHGVDCTARDYAYAIICTVTTGDLSRRGSAVARNACTADCLA